ncbi:MAG: ATP synthase F1 subunit gamma, partial [Bacteroidota bacterium]
KHTRNLINNQYQGATITVLSIGKKADDFFKRTEYNIKGTTLPRNPNELYDDLTFANVSDVAQKIMDAFANKQFDRVVLVYNKFKNAAVQLITEEQFLPVVPPASEEGSSQQTDHIFEPDREEIVQELIPKSLKTQLFKALLDSFASEHGARMTAMHKATDNASDLLKELRLTYNKARQAAITTEILEIVGGAEALNN